MTLSLHHIVFLSVCVGVCGYSCSQGILWFKFRTMKHYPLEECTDACSPPYCEGAGEPMWKCPKCVKSSIWGKCHYAPSHNKDSQGRPRGGGIKHEWGCPCAKAWGGEGRRCAGAAGPSVRGSGGSVRQGPLREGPAQGATTALFINHVQYRVHAKSLIGAL